MWEYFKAGGPVMWPLLAVSLISLTIIIERLIFWVRLGFYRKRDRVIQFLDFVGQDDLGEAAHLAQGSRDPVLKTLHCGLVHRNWSLSQAMAQQGMEEVTQMKRYLTTLDTIITAAPLLGILGTVTGIVKAFQVLGGGLPDPKAVTGGIAEALITTVFGLIIALYTLFPYNIFGAKVNQTREEIEKYASSMEILFQKKQSMEEPSGQPRDFTYGSAAAEPEPQPDHPGGLSEKEKRFFS